MSRGMGRGGFRGRGRGGPKTGASSDARFPGGFDAVELKFENPDRIFPDWEPAEPVPPTERELKLASVARSFTRTMVHSPYYLTLSGTTKKAGSGERERPRGPDAKFEGVPAEIKFFPEELRPLKDPSIRPVSYRPTRPRDTTGLSKEDLDKIEQEESQAQRNRKGAGGVVDYDAAEGFWEDDGYDEEEMEEETDYQMDYYADDDGVEEGGEGGEDYY